MLDMGKQTKQFFDSYVDVFGHKKYRLKTLEQYSREHNANEQPGKQYFKATTLPEIINTAPMPTFKSTTRQGHEMEKGTLSGTLLFALLRNCLSDSSDRAQQPRVVYRFLSGFAQPEPDRAVVSTTGQNAPVYHRRKVFQAVPSKSCALTRSPVFPRLFLLATILLGTSSDDPVMISQMDIPLK